MIYQIFEVFFVGLLIDLLFILWMYASRTYKYTLGAITSVGIAACSLFGFINIYDSKLLAIPYLLGLAVGTIIGMVIQKRIENGNN